MIIFSSSEVDESEDKPTVDVASLKRAWANEKLALLDAIQAMKDLLTQTAAEAAVRCCHVWCVHVCLKHLLVSSDSCFLSKTCHQQAYISQQRNEQIYVLSVLTEWNWTRTTPWNFAAKAIAFSSKRRRWKRQLAAQTFPVSDVRFREGSIDRP